MEHKKRVPMTDLDYEDCYARALTILREKYDSVGVPYRNEDGDRLCDVETLHADDLTVFMLAWGAEIAYQIAYSKTIEHERGRPHRRQNLHARSAASAR